MVDTQQGRTYHRAPMSAALPEVLDAWRAVASRRHYEGMVPLSALPRLAGSLADTEGEVRYAVSFDRDASGVGVVVVEVTTALPLICQRSLARFLLPVEVRQRLGLLAREADEAGLPAGVEPLLVPDGTLRPFEVVEDELILALPVVPLDPASEDRSQVVWSTGPANASETEDTEPRSPFAVLSKLKK